MHPKRLIRNVTMSIVVVMALTNCAPRIPLPEIPVNRLAQTTETLNVHIFHAPPSVCSGETVEFLLEVQDSKGRDVPYARVDMLAPDDDQIGHSTNSAGMVGFDYTPKTPGKQEIRFVALREIPSGQGTATLSLEVVRCIYVLNLNHRGTYQFNRGGVTATLSVLALVDGGEMRIGADGIYVGKTEIFFSEQASGQVEDCVFTTTAAEGTGGLDMRGTLAEDTVAVSLTFQPFSVSWVVSGTCAEEEASVSVFAGPGSVDLSLLGVNNFTVAADGGSVNRAVPSPAPFSGEGTVTVIVFPKEEKPATATAPSAPIVYERNQ